MKAIEFRSVSKTYPHAAKPAVHNVSLGIESGQIIVILGPSGCGKTTLLKMVNRLYEPTTGQILINGQEIHEIPVNQLRRSIGYVIQQGGLFPHMTVEDNINVVPGMLGWSKERIRERTEFLLEMVGMDPAVFLKRFPMQLSGGQQQRVGLARAMAADPAFLLMDEPFGAVDAINRGHLQDELLRIQHRMRKTILFVTHDAEEAFRLADMIIVMREGEVVQYGTSQEIIFHPQNETVDGLIGGRDVIRQLHTIKAGSVMEPVNGRRGVAGLRLIRLQDDLKTAMAVLLESGANSLGVVDENEEIVGVISWGLIRKIGYDVEHAVDASSLRIEEVVNTKQAL